jgi:hypothetical protein
MTTKPLNYLASRLALNNSGEIAIAAVSNVAVMVRSRRVGTHLRTTLVVLSRFVEIPYKDNNCKCAGD